MGGCNKGDSLILKEADSACKKIDKSNQKKRKRFTEYIKKLAPKTYIQRAKSTIAGSIIIQSNRGNKVSLLKMALSCLNSGIKKSIQHAYVRGLSTKQRYNGLKLCKKTYDFPPPKDRNGGHAEARLLAHYAKKGLLSGATIVINVDWANPNRASFKDPCQSCFDMLCLAASAEGCGAQIYMCDKNNEPVNIKEFCENPDKQDGADSLSKALNNPILNKKTV